MSSLTPLRRPPALRPGDRVTVVAPSGPVDPARLRAGCRVLESYGLNVAAAEHVLDRTGRYLAGDDVARAKDFERAWLDPDVAGILCARGGYGSMRMVDLVAWDTLVAAPPKLFAGSSDVTALHEAIGVRLGVATLFAPMVATGLVGTARGWSLDAYRGALLGDWDGLRVAASPAWVANPGRVRGVTVGGNLSLLAATVGSTESRPAAGGIALLEDAGEQPYRLDRLLTQLLRARWFDGVAGVGLGAWIDCGGPGEAEAVLRERLAPLGVPLLGGLPFGHGRAQASIPLGVAAELDTATGTIAVGTV